MKFIDVYAFDLAIALGVYPASVLFRPVNCPVFKGIHPDVNVDQWELHSKLQCGHIIERSFRGGGGSCLYTTQMYTMFHGLRRQR